jgi:predicted HTH domain antitoxin
VFETDHAIRDKPMTTRQITINIPEKVLLAEKTDEVSFARELTMLAAVKLYELGRLSSGRAAELAAMSRVEFLLSLGRYKVFPFQDELTSLESQNAWSHQ